METETMQDNLQQFFLEHYPEEPRKLIRCGYEVPLPYIVKWMHTYGCNNWRRLHGLPTLRGSLKP